MGTVISEVIPACTTGIPRENSLDAEFVVCIPVFYLDILLSEKNI